MRGPTCADEGACFLLWHYALGVRFSHFSVACAVTGAGASFCEVTARAFCQRLWHGLPSYVWSSLHLSGSQPCVQIPLAFSDYRTALHLKPVDAVRDPRAPSELRGRTPTRRHAPRHSNELEYPTTSTFQTVIVIDCVHRYNQDDLKLLPSSS